MTAGRDFGELLRTSARQHRDRIAMTCETVQQTYGELFERSCRLAQALAALGVEPGDRVALLGPNSRWTVEHAAGIALGGFVRAALYAHQTAEVNAYLTDLVDAKVLIVAAVAADELLARKHEMTSLTHVVVYDGPAPAGALDYEDLVAAAKAEDPLVRTAPTDLHVIRFSAGTTGRPKGIAHTVEGWMRSNDEYRWVTPQLDERDVYLALGQLTHAASVFLWPILQVGARVVVVPAFNPGLALELIETERATFTLVVPTMIQAMVAHPDASTRDLSSLRCVNYAASPISEATLLRAVELFGDDVMYQMYAQSEAWPITMLLPHEHRDRPRSVGRATPNNVLTIVDDDGRPVPPGEIGEIAVRGAGRMLQVWKEPETTAARTLPDGSLRTRDMGRLDAQGYLFLADRKDDLIISGGFNIWPAELENAIAAHPAVAEVAVVGVPHDKWGETPIAVVVAAPGAVIDEAEIIAFCREKVGAVHKVTAVEVVDELPKSGVGKVLR
ncbi:MAG TPA: AMP-binding protein, partial [Sporichthya sp.]|nr:AMP-binding protein [Sporichthya sp.]